MNGDGRMDFNEFSIACKLINLKLKGMELPKSLPPQVSPLFLHAEGDGIISVIFHKSALFYLLKEMELPKSHHPLVSPLS
jgi:hypothetical protein